MAIVIRFVTDKFDVSKERVNPINPIPGESLLLWLKSRVNPPQSFSHPEPEDWGWYSYMDINGRTYLIGCSASEEESEEREWVLQIEKQRSVVEKVLGKEKMLPDDDCLLAIKALLEGETRFEGIHVEA
jgi:hypothetical protein